MKIVSLLENISLKGMPVEHGLSLYIETERGQKILFDMGQSPLFAENAQRLGVQLESVQTAILSHGHYDHGGGLATFLALNTQAPVYVHLQAFEPHYSLRDNGIRYIGLDPSLQSHPQLRFCSNDTRLNAQMLLFSQVTGHCLCPPGNQLLYGPTPTEHDAFHHEQNLLIEEGNNRILIAGCAHGGIVNILERAEQLIEGPITHVLAGMHLAKHGLSRNEEAAYMEQLSHQLLSRPQCQYYTMHCTGQEAYLQLKQRMHERIQYLACGDSIHIL